MSLRADLRRFVRQRDGFRCGYCGVRENEAGAELTIDHFQPRSQGGSDTAENLVYCCHACNEFKSDFWQPDTASGERLLHPLRDDLSAHIVENDDSMLLALTETGAFHIAYLHLNRPGLVGLRRDRRHVQVTQQERQEMLQRMRLLEERVNTLQTEFDTFTGAGSEEG